MAVGFETYVEGTTDIQLSNNAVYFRLRQKGIIPQPSQWFNPSAGIGGAYWWCEVTIPISGVVNPVVAVRPLVYPTVLYVTVAEVTTTHIRLWVHINDKNRQIQYYIYDTTAPSPNPSGMGLELYKDGYLVFASETPVLRPLPNVNNSAQIHAAVCNKQSYYSSYDFYADGDGKGFYDDVKGYGAINFMDGGALIDADLITHDSGSSSGNTDYTIYRENAFFSWQRVDVTGH